MYKWPIKKCHTPNPLQRGTLKFLATKWDLEKM